jgi:sec-independent protein translocase protein TatB
MMANLGMADTLILMVLALVVFGPRRLPQIGRQIGKLMYEFRKASNDFKFQMEEELRQSEEADRRQKEEAERQKALAASPPVPQLDAPAPQIDPPAGSVAESAAPSLPETPTESPYPGETGYPDVAAEVTRTQESIEDLTAAAVEAERLRPEESIAPSIEPGSGPGVEPSIEPRIQPRIQPVSTGEVVAANPPGRPAQQTELFERPVEAGAEPAASPNVPSPVDAAATAPESTTPDAANGTHRSEPAAHHG